MKKAKYYYLLFDSFKKVVPKIQFNLYLLNENHVLLGRSVKKDKMSKLLWNKVNFKFETGLFSNFVDKWINRY